MIRRNINTIHGPIKSAAFQKKIGTISGDQKLNLALHQSSYLIKYFFTCIYYYCKSEIEIIFIISTGTLNLGNQLSKGTTVPQGI